MKLTYLNQWLNDREVNAICWTLFHSLWIGLVVASLAGIIVACTRKATGNLRYRLFCGLLLFFVILMVGVATMEITGNDQGRPKHVLLVSLTSQTISEDNLAAYPTSVFQRTLVDLLNKNAGWIFALWSVCFLFKSMQLLAGVFYLRRIRTHKIQMLNEEWNAKVTEFSNRMRIKKRVSIVQSALVKIPVAIGYLKPVIVLPLGLICQLPAAQIEMILWHELAHIYRRDYLVNLLQRMVEAIFFFNPAVLWLSELIREEREACCDEIVLGNVEHKVSYLKALATFHTEKSGAGGLAMGLNLRPNQLINRIKRMVNRENRRLGGVELIVLLTGLMALSAFTLIPQVKPAIKKEVVSIKKAVSETLAAVTPGKIRTDKTDARPYVSSMTMIPDQQDTAKGDTSLIFKSIRFKNSNEDKNNRELNVIDGQDNRYHVIVVNGQLTLVEFNEQGIAESEFKKYEPLLTQIDQLIQKKLTGPFPKGDIEAKFAKKPSLASQKSELPAFKKSLSDSLNKQPDKSKKVPVVDASADKARVLGVIASLVQNKVVSSASSVVWFALTADQLVVNDQKQNEQLHQQLKEKYGVKPNNGLFFGPNKVYGTGIVFEPGDL